MNLRATTAAALAVALLVTTPAWAQRASASPRVEFRPFALVTDERFSAATTFDAVFGSTMQPLWGGGLEVTTRKNLFVDVAVSHMSRTGERAFLYNGQVFRIGIPLRVSLTPIEVTSGYRFPLTNRRGRRRRVIPYVGAGIGWYRYGERSDFAVEGEDVNATHAGFVALGGAEFRVARRIGITGDAQYTIVPGIIGGTSVTSLSGVAGENDLGGIAARVRVIFGR